MFLTEKKIFYFATFPEKQKANVENADISSEDHWLLYALFSHLTNCSFIYLANHWSDSGWDDSWGLKGCVVVVSRRGAPDSWDRIVLGKACIRSAYSKLGKSLCLLFLWYWKVIQPYYLLKFTPNCKWYRELQRANWLIYKKKPSEAE